MNQLALPFALNTKLLLANFLGKDNQQAVCFVSSLLEQKTSAAVYITGVKSSGKTHFLQACVLAALKRDLNAVYIDFTQDLPTDILSSIGTPDWICIDNVEYLDVNQARELFDLYNQISANKQKLIISAACFPYDLKLLQDLKTRLSQALIFSLKSLSDKEKIQVLENKMNAKNIAIESKVYDYLFKHYSRDLSEILDLIKIMDRHSLQQKSKINIALIKQVLD